MVEDEGQASINNIYQPVPHSGSRLVKRDYQIQWEKEFLWPWDKNVNVPVETLIWTKDLSKGLQISDK